MSILTSIIQLGFTSILFYEFYIFLKNIIDKMVKMISLKNNIYTWYLMTIIYFFQFIILIIYLILFIRLLLSKSFLKITEIILNYNM